MEERLNARDTTFDAPRFRAIGSGDQKTVLVPEQYLEDASR